MTIFAAERKTKSAQDRKTALVFRAPLLPRAQASVVFADPAFRAAELCEVVKVALVCDGKHRSKAVEIDIGGANIMARGHAKLLRLLQDRYRILLYDFQQRRLRWLCLAVNQIHDLALVFADNATMRLRNEIAHVGGVPVITARQAGLVV